MTERQSGSQNSLQAYLFIGAIMSGLAYGYGQMEAYNRMHRFLADWYADDPAKPGPLLLQIEAMTQAVTRVFAGEWEGLRRFCERRGTTVEAFLTDNNRGVFLAGVERQRPFWEPMTPTADMVEQAERELQEFWDQYENEVSRVIQEIRASG